MTLGSKRSDYDDYATEYAAYVAWRERAGAGSDDLGIVPHLLEVLGDVSDQNVLDAGCGEGYLARILAARGARVTGIDLSPRLIALGRAKAYRGRGEEWAEEALGVGVEIVNRTPKPAPEKVLRVWARVWFKDGREMDLKKLPKRPAFENLPRRWVAERTFARISHNRRMSLGTTSVCARRARPSSTRR